MNVNQRRESVENTLQIDKRCHREGERERERATLIRWNGTTIDWMTMSNNEYDQRALSLTQFPRDQQQQYWQGRS